MPTHTSDASTGQSNPPQTQQELQQNTFKSATTMDRTGIYSDIYNVHAARKEGVAVSTSLPYNDAWKKPHVHTQDQQQHQASLLAGRLALNKSSVELLQSVLGPNNTYANVWEDMYAQVLTRLSEYTKKETDKYQTDIEKRREYSKTTPRQQERALRIGDLDIFPQKDGKENVLSRALTSRGSSSGTSQILKSEEEMIAEDREEAKGFKKHLAGAVRVLSDERYAKDMYRVYEVAKSHVVKDNGVYVCLCVCMHAICTSLSDEKYGKDTYIHTCTHTYMHIYLYTWWRRASLLRIMAHMCVCVYVCVPYVQRRVVRDMIRTCIGCMFVCMYVCHMYISER